MMYLSEQPIDEEEILRQNLQKTDALIAEMKAKVELLENYQSYVKMAIEQEPEDYVQGYQVGYGFRMTKRHLKYLLKELDKITYA